MTLDLRGTYVLVTGASAGLGREIARDLAKKHGAHLVLVARREDRLLELAAELEKAHGTKSVVITADLTLPGDLDRVFEGSVAVPDLRAVVLNAGVTFFGDAIDQNDASVDALVATNVTAVAKLALRFGAYFRTKGRGAIQLVSSMAGFSPLPFQTMYAASKAFVTSFGRSLAFELRGTGVTVGVFAPGGIATEMLESSGLSRGFKPGVAGIMEADVCAAYAVRGLVAGEELTIPGAQNALLAATMKLAPHGLVKGVVAKIYEKARKLGWVPRSERGKPGAKRLTGGARRLMSALPQFQGDRSCVS
jgi:hypothetical protein